MRTRLCARAGSLPLLAALNRRRTPLLTRGAACSVHTTRWCAASTQAVVNIFGTNRTGLVADVAQILYDKGGSVQESRMNRMGDYFSIMMMTTIKHEDEAPPAVLEGLQTALSDGLSTLADADASEPDNLCAPLLHRHDCPA